jgi:hypothetical protein
MGRLVVDNETCREYPATISMVIGYLEREHHGVMRGSFVRDGCTEFVIDGDGIPTGLEKFRVEITQVVKGVVNVNVIK